MTAHGTGVFGEAVRMVADALGIELDEVRCDAEYAQTTEDLDLGSWTIGAGCVAGVYASWKGIVGDATVVEIAVRWRKGQTLEPDWKIEQDGWVIEVAGRPTVTMKVGFLPPPDFEADHARGVHGARAHHDGDASAQCDPRRGRGTARHRDLQRPSLDSSARSGRYQLDV